MPVPFIFPSSTTISPVIDSFFIPVLPPVYVPAVTITLAFEALEPIDIASLPPVTLILVAEMFSPPVFARYIPFSFSDVIVISLDPDIFMSALLLLFIVAAPAPLFFIFPPVISSPLFASPLKYIAVP